MAEIHRWPLQETSGTALDDVTGANDATIDSGVTLGATGPGGSLPNAIQLDGSSIGPIDLTSPVVLAANTDWSIFLWFKKDNVGDNQGMCLGEEGSTVNYIWNTNNQDFKVQGASSSVSFVHGDVLRFELHHYSLVYDSTANTLSLYIDGVFSEVLAFNDSFTVDCIGAGFNTASFSLEGVLADIRIFDSQASQGEIDAAVAAGSNPAFDLAMHFDGADSRLTADLPAGFPATGFSLHCAFSVFGAGHGHQTLLAGRNRWNLRINSSGEYLAFTTDNVKDYNSSFVPTPGVEYKVFIVLDTNFDAHFYIDGAFIETVTHGSGPLAATELLIGDYWSPGRTFGGEIHDARVFSREVTAQEISDHSANPTSELLATGGQWKGENQLDVAGGAVTIYDSSGNNNDGVGSGGISTVIGAAYSFNRDVGYGSGTAIQGLYITRDESAPSFDDLGNPLAGVSLTVASIVDNQVFQRAFTGDLNVTVSGVAPTAATVEVQIDAGGWTTLDVAAADLYSGTVGVPPGNKTIGVRLSSDTGNVISTLIHVSDVLLWLGQSNSDNTFDDPQVYAGALGFRIYDEDNVWIAGATGYQSAGPGGGTGYSILPRLATEIESITGAPVAFVCETEGGVGITTGPWGSSPPGARYLAAVAAVLDSDVSGIRAAIIDVGESDTSGPPVSAATVEAAFADFHTNMQADTSLSFPFIITQTGTATTASSDANIDSVRQGQQAAVDNNADIHFGVIGYDRANLHWQTPTEATTYTARLVAAIDEAIFDGQLGTPPRLTSAVVDKTSVSLFFDRNILVETLAAAAWSFDDDGSPIAVTAAVKDVGRRVILTLASEPVSTTLSVAIGLGNDGQGVIVPKGMGGQPTLPESLAATIATQIYPRRVDVPLLLLLSGVSVPLGR